MIIKLKDNNFYKLKTVLEDDYKEVFSFYVKFIEESGGKYISSTKYDIRNMKEGDEIFWIKRINKRGFIYSFSKENDKDILGLLNIERSITESLKHIGILSVGVLNEFQGISLGFELVKNAVLKSKQIGITKIELEVIQDNQKAINLYKKIGFFEEGLRLNAMKIDDAYVNIKLMGLII